MGSKWKYKEITVGENIHRRQNGCVLEHILVVEEKLGRQLFKKEIVHHIDNNPENNDPKNLMVFRNQGDHFAFHKGSIAIKQEDGIYIAERKIRLTKCRKCGKETDNLKYCSRKCYSYSDRKRKVNWPTKEELLEMVKKETKVAIAKKLGVSDKAVVKWCIKYNIPWRKHKIRLLVNGKPTASKAVTEGSNPSNRANANVA